MKKWIMGLGLGAVLLTGTASALNEQQRLSCGARCERRYQNEVAQLRNNLRACRAAPFNDAVCWEVYTNGLYAAIAERDACQSNCAAN